jgi:hypothetical protein
VGENYAVGVVGGGNAVPEEVVVCGVKYKRAEEAPTGNRAVVVVDRGWIFAGDVEVRDAYLILSRAVWVFKWSEIGFDRVIADPKNSKVTLRRMPGPVAVPIDSEIFRCPVAADWGL